jgi:predicted kinase
MTYVLVTGPAASGKSTLSRALADELGLPLLAKDAIKQALLDTEGAADVEASRALGGRAVDELLEAARAVGQGVLDSVWVDRPRARRELAALGEVLEVFCRADLDLMRARYAARTPSKGRGHFDEQRSDDELWPPASRRPLAGGWPVLEVDTGGDVDVASVVRWARRTADGHFGSLPGDREG